MGEHAKYDGETIKIGTCENLYGVRAEQRHWLTESSIDFEDPEVLREVRFRFPFPDEDEVPPGHEFWERGFDRGVVLHDCSAPEGVSHRGNCSKPNRIEIVQQKIVGEQALLIGRCPECSSRFNFPNLEYIVPVLEACKGMTEHHDLCDSVTGEDTGNGRFWLEMALRIAAGYGVHPDPEQVAAKLAKPKLVSIPSQPFKFYTDPGHGWLAVKRKLLHQLGIECKITSFSYQRGETVYLEEDSDVATFFKAFEAATGEKPRTEEGSHTNSQSRIRSYARYCPEVK